MGKLANAASRLGRRGLKRTDYLVVQILHLTGDQSEPGEGLSGPKAHS